MKKKKECNIAEARTRNIWFGRPALYQLSYDVARRTRLELVSSVLETEMLSIYTIDASADT